MARILAIGLFILALSCGRNNFETGITLIENGASSGKDREYVYVPPKDIDLPPVLYCKAFFKNEKLDYERARIVRNGEEYKFSLTIPDSAQVLVIGIFDAANQLIDNNGGQSYIVPLENKYVSTNAKLGIRTAETLLSSARRVLSLSTSRAEILAYYIDSYNKDPRLKDKDSYSDYLTLGYYENREKGREEILRYLSHLDTLRSGEEELMQAKALYNVLGDEEESLRLRDMILKRFPNGITAKQSFLDSIDNAGDHSAELLLELRSDFLLRFGNEDPSIDYFALQMIDSNLEEGRFSQAWKAEDQLRHVSSVLPLYNSHLDRLVNAEKQAFEVALKLSERIISVAKKELESSMDSLNYAYILQQHARLLYEIDLTDSAFSIQNELFEKDFLNQEGIEEYVLYAEKVKDIYFIKSFIEDRLLEGLFSSRLLMRFELILDSLDSSNEAFSSFRNRYKTLLKKKWKQRILLQFGKSKAPDFTLLNLQGDSCGIHSLKGKVVVLDFWATWCKPCRAGFPRMQELIDHYRDSNDVEFFFVDVLEQGKSFNAMHEQASYILQNKGYTFNVLIDDQDLTVPLYKLIGLPTKVVIDQNGDIVVITQSKSLDDLEFQIEVARS